VTYILRGRAPSALDRGGRLASTPDWIGSLHRSFLHRSVTRKRFTGANGNGYSSDSFHFVGWLVGYVFVFLRAASSLVWHCGHFFVGSIIILVVFGHFCERGVFLAAVNAVVPAEGAKCLAFFPTAVWVTSSGDRRLKSKTDIARLFQHLSTNKGIT